MENQSYNLRDKVIGTLEYVAYKTSLMPGIVLNKQDFIMSAYERRIQIEKDQESQNHRDYYNRSKI